MQGNANIESRSEYRRKLGRFTRTLSVNDMRPEESTRRHRAERYAKRNKTCGKRAEFEVGPRISLLQAHREGWYL